MVGKQSVAPATQRRLTIIRGGTQRASGVLVNLMADTSAPALSFLAERYGLHRIPGLTKQALVQRLLRHLSSTDLERLKDDLIAARYGALSVDSLVRYALVRDIQRVRRPAPRLDRVSPDEAMLVESSTRRWVYTLRGHDVLVDLARRTLSCDCPYFQFSSRRRALCKHLATVFELIPEVYAREALIDLLVSREYGDRGTPSWNFKARASI